jgi:hypothetical protein
MPRILSLLFVLVAFVISACKENKKSGVDLDQKGGSADETFSLQVQDLPADWEKRIAERSLAEKARVAQLLKSSLAGESVLAGDIALLRKHRNDVIPALQKSIENDWRAGGDAFELLLDLEAPGARERWFAEFKKGDARTREKLLDILAFNERDEEVTNPRNAEEEEVIRAALSGPGFTHSALYKIEDPTTVAAGLLDQLPKLPRDDQWPIASFVASAKLDAAQAQRLLAWAREQASQTKPNDAPDDARLIELPRFDKIHSVLMLVAELCAFDSIRADAEKFFAELDAKFPDALLDHRSQTIIMVFSRHATAASRPLLERLHRESKDPTARGSVFAALAWIRGPEVLPELVPMLAVPQQNGPAWLALEELAAHGHREKVEAFILREIPRPDARSVYYALRQGGPAVLKHVLEKLPAEELPGTDRFDLEWKARGLTTDSFLSRLKELGLISRLPTEREIADARRSAGVDPSPTAELFILLERLGVYWVFDAEADEFPPPYQRLYRQFAAFTKDAFSFQGFQQREVKAAGEEVEESSIVEFAAAGKLFVIRTPPIGDWFDLGAVEGAVNRALELSGKKERIIGIETESQEARYVFGSPEVWQQVAKEFAFPLAKGPSQAVKEGKDFEKEVLEALKKEGGLDGPKRRGE